MLLILYPFVWPQRRETQRLDLEIFLILFSTISQRRIEISWSKDYYKRLGFSKNLKKNRKGFFGPEIEGKGQGSKLIRQAPSGIPWGIAKETSLYTILLRKLTKKSKKLIRVPHDVRRRHRQNFLPGHEAPRSKTRVDSGWKNVFQAELALPLCQALAAGLFFTDIYKFWGSSWLAKK